MRHIPEGLKDEKDAIALLARKHGSWLVTLEIGAEVVTVLMESPVAVDEMISLELRKAEEERAVEQATKTKNNTETPN